MRIGTLNWRIESRRWKVKGGGWEVGNVKSKVENEKKLHCPPGSLRRVMARSRATLDITISGVLLAKLFCGVILCKQRENDYQNEVRKIVFRQPLAVYGVFFRPPSIGLKNDARRPPQHPLQR